MAAKENFFKAMKELTGMGGAEDTSKTLFAVSPTPEPVVRPIPEKADEPLSDQGLEDDLPQETEMKGEQEALNNQFWQKSGQEEAQSDLLQRMLKSQNSSEKSQLFPDSQSTEQLQPSEQSQVSKQNQPMPQEQSQITEQNDLTEQSQAPEQNQPTPQPQNAANGFLGNWPLQQDKPQQEPSPKPDEPRPPEQPKEPQGPNATVISASMVITGEVKSTGDLNILGMIKGPVITTGNLIIEGKILGNIEGNDIVLKGCAIQGNINATGNVNLDMASVIVGDLKAVNLEVNGKIKGNLAVQERIDLNKDAIVDGNASSRFVSMSQGARLNGNVSVTADSSEDEDIFDIRFDI